MFSNKVVIITGGSAGIGAGTAENFAKEGALLTIVGRNEARLNKVAENCQKLGAKVLAIKADISKEDEAKTVIQKTIDKFGKLDVLVNNAGIVRFARIVDSNVMGVYDEVLNTNLRPVVLLTSLAVPYLKESKGNVVNISSTASTKLMLPGLGAYGMSKAAMDHFTRSSAADLAPFGVRVNSVNPGPVITDIQESTPPMPDYIMSNIGNMGLPPLGRMSEIQEVAELIMYVASYKAKSITGSCYVQDNGALLQ